MGDLSQGRLDPRANEEDFGFGFNNEKFSDHVLHIEIEPEDPLPPKRKRYKLRHSDQSKNSDCCDGIEVKSLHISSLILAGKSLFFYKLFTNGMRESQGKDVTLRISSSEKKALMDMLKYMYSNTLSATTRSDLLDVLMVADKFEVTSCIEYCIELLMKLPMSLESALSYLELPSAVLEAEVIEPLIDASKQYIFASNFSKFQVEAMKLTLSALEIVLGLDGLRVHSEDDVYEFILKWGRANYPNLKERREVLTKRLAQLISFPYMSCSKLKEFQNCPDFDHEKLSKLVMKALFYKFEVLGGQHILVSKAFGGRFSGRLYEARLVKGWQLDFPQIQRVIYFDLKKQECANLLPSEQLYSQPFLLGGRWLKLMAQRSKKHIVEKLGLFVQMRKGSEPCPLKFEIALMNSSEMLKGKVSSSILTEKRDWGWHNFLSWTKLMRDDSEFFVDGILHIRADLTIINSKA